MGKVDPGKEGVGPHVRPASVLLAPQAALATADQSADEILCRLRDVEMRWKLKFPLSGDESVATQIRTFSSSLMYLRTAMWMAGPVCPAKGMSPVSIS